MQEARPRRLGERTVDYGLAAMDFCGTLPRTAAGRHVAACGRSVPATSSQQRSSQWRGDARPHSTERWIAGCWLLRRFGAKRRLMVAVRVEACARRGRRVAACRIAGTAVDGRQEHQHRVRPHAGQNHRSVGSMPTHKKTVGRVRWGVPGGAAMRLTRHDNSDWLLRCWLLVAETLPTH